MLRSQRLFSLVFGGGSADWERVGLACLNESSGLRGIESRKVITQRRVLSKPRLGYTVSTRLFAAILGSLIVVAMSLPVIAQQNSESSTTTTTTQDTNNRRSFERDSRLRSGQLPLCRHLRCGRFEAGRHHRRYRIALDGLDAGKQAALS